MFDSTRVAFGSPNRAGMYLVTAIASKANYNPGVGSGVLVVKMHISGASLSWNNSETTYAASALKADTLNATLMRGDSAADNQSGVHYRYIGFTAAHKLYVSSKAPTEAGTYRQTAHIFGGNDMAKVHLPHRDDHGGLSAAKKLPEQCSGSFLFWIGTQWLSAMR